MTGLSAMWHGIRRALIFIIGTLLVLGIAPVAAQDGNEAVSLSIKPVGTSDSFFTLTAAPGDVLDLEVELANHGTVPVTVQTYPADAYSLINGGFGVDLADEETSGTTEWIDYPVETFELDAQTSTIRGIQVQIPEDAKPGEYLSSVVIQNAIPTAASGTGVGFQQVNRQAIAISIELPGEAAPGLAIGEVSHKFAGGNSVLLVAVENTGNRHMKLEGDIVLTGAGGSEILARPVSMGTVYAGTSTYLEVPVKAQLEAGDYDVSLSLGNQELNVAETIEQAPVAVPEAPDAPIPANPQPDTAAESEGASAAPPAAENNAAAVAEQPQPATPAPASQSTIEPWMLIAGIVAALVLGAGGATLGVAMMRRRSEPRDERTLAPTADAPALSPTHAAVSGGSGATEYRDPEPAPEPVIEEDPAPRNAPASINQRSSTGVRNLLQATNHIRSDIPSVDGLRAEDWKN
ncbi:MAG: hypothetical protein R3A46_19275 [Thermomicrobiales bacterium]